jgi:hypothetical protein
MQRPSIVGWVAVVLMGSVACADFETGHFQSRVNEATEEMVVKRYGPPHQIEQREGNQTVWTYFDRGSGTSGYAGTSRSSFCIAYLLTFDQRGILRVWQQQECEN